MGRERKPWEVPVIYNDDRFDSAIKAEGTATKAALGPNDDDEARSGRDIDDLLSRPGRAGGSFDREYECNDTTPINYKSGPHDKAFGVDDNDFDEPDAVPVSYDKGPHDEEFGVEDEDLDSLPDADSDEPFDD